jgi:hypothetical protein
MIRNNPDLILPKMAILYFLNLNGGENSVSFLNYNVDKRRPNVPLSSSVKFCV